MNRKIARNDHKIKIAIKKIYRTDWEHAIIRSNKQKKKNLEVWIVHHLKFHYFILIRIESSFSICAHLMNYGIRTMKTLKWATRSDIYMYNISSADKEHSFSSVPTCIFLLFSRWIGCFSSFIYVWSSLYIHWNIGMPPT